MKNIFVFLFSLTLNCSLGQYSRIKELLFPKNDINQSNVIIDSFLNGENEKFYYLYGRKNQPNCFEIINLLAIIRAENNYDSISYLEELYLTYLPLHRTNWNQPYSSMGFRFDEFKNLLTSFRMTLLDAGMNKLNWDISQKYFYLKSQEIDGWFENRLISYEQEKIRFPDGKKPNWYVEFDTSQLYRISSLDSIKSIFPTLFKNNFNQFLSLEANLLLKEQFPKYAECIYSEMESNDFFNNDKYIGKKGFDFSLLELFAKTTFKIDSNRLNNILTKGFKKIMNGGIHFRDIFIKYANENLINEYCKEILMDCSFERWKLISFSSESDRKIYLNNRIGVYLLEKSDNFDCKLIGLNKIKYPDKLTKIKIQQIYNKEKNKTIKNSIREKLQNVKTN